MNERMEFYRRFIATWHAEQTLDDVCSAMQLDKRFASNLASDMRRRGVELPPRKAKGVTHGLPGQVIWDDLRRWSETCRSAERNRRLREGV